MAIEWLHDEEVTLTPELWRALMTGITPKIANKVKPRKMVQISWGLWDQTVRQLARQLKTMPQPQPKQLIGITRGGAIVAVQLSHLLDIPYVHTIHAHAYSKNGVFGELRTEKLTTFGAPQLSPRDVKESLFCDDIIDSGFTALELANKYEGARFVAPVGRIDGINKLQNKLYGMPPIVIHSDSWIEFPWEASEPIDINTLMEDL